MTKLGTEVKQLEEETISLSVRQIPPTNLVSELYQRLSLPYYIVNFLFCSTFFIIRNVPALYNFLDLSLEPPETSIYLVIGTLVILKFKSTASAEEWLSVSFLYLKLLNVIMFYLFGKTLWAVLYAIMWSALFASLPQPSYQGPTEIIELSDQDLNEIKRGGYKPHKFKELSAEEYEKIKKSEKSEGKKQVDQHWIVFFYATWSPACKVFESTVAKTSVKYTTSDVHFGKIDLDLYPNLAQEHEISLSPMSLDLPALIYLKNGTENGRLPKRLRDGDDAQLDQITNQTLKNAKVTWDRLGWDRSMESIITTFKLDTLIKNA